MDRVTPVEAVALLEALPDALVVVDAAGHITHLNRQAEALFGYTRAQLVGQSVDLLLPRALRELHTAHRAGFVATPVARPMGSGLHLRAARADGRELPVEVSLSPLTLGGELHVIAAVRDLTERQRMEAALIVADRMTSVATVATGLAHELNNPLTSVIANLEFAIEAIAQRAADDESLRRALDDLLEARRGAARMRELVRDVAYFSQDDVVTTPVDVAKVVDAALRVVPRELRRGVAVARAFQRVPAVIANESRLGQVFLNILINAFQAVATRARGPAVRVGIRGERETVLVEVADNGPGIAADIRERIFTPFFTTKQSQGTGLGLAISHAIVTSFGGTIELRGEPQEGATFCVRLPASSDVIAPPRVLVIEDEPGIARAVQRMLEPEYEVTVTHDGADALARIQATPDFDVILCDLMLPGMSGMELHAALRAAHPEQADAMVFMTGARHQPGAESFFDALDNPCLEKPFHADELRQVVAEVARRAAIIGDP